MGARPFGPRPPGPTPRIGSAAPEYYGYNYGNDIVYDNGSVYYAGQDAGTPQQYYQEAADLANTGGTAAATGNAQWLPLGVFGLMSEGQKTPDMVFQLAVNKQGVIRGNYYDQVTQTNLPVTGQVDEEEPSGWPGPSAAARGSWWRRASTT